MGHFGENEKHLPSYRQTYSWPLCPDIFIHMGGAMSRRVALNLSYLALFLACVYGAGCNGCSGAPANFNAVTVSTPTPVILQGGTAAISGVVANDTSGDGVSWSLTGVGSLTGATRTSVTYQAPATVAAETVVTVKATSVSFTSSSNTISITVEPTPSITTTSLPAASAGTNYTAQVSATGGVPPFTWSVVSGSLTSQLALNGSTTRTVTIGGIPLTQTTDNFTLQIKDSLGTTGQKALSIAIGAPLPLQVTTTSLPVGTAYAMYPRTQLQSSGGIPPVTWSLTTLPATFPPGLTLAANGIISGTPTATGNYTFGVLATDGETPAMTAPATLTIDIDNLSALSGNYAFEFSGFDSSGNGVAIAGSFTADGAGNITNGVDDVSSVAVAHVTEEFTGTYTLDAYGQGVLTFSSLSGSPAYAFTLGSTAIHGSIIRFDASGIRGSGDMQLRTVSTCTDTTLSGPYAFGLMGHQAATSDSAAGPLAIVGAFTATAASGSATTGSIASAEMDANTPAKVTAQDKVLSGTYQAASQAARCSMSLTSTLPNMDLAVYPISTTTAFLVSTDTVSSTTPMVIAGSMQQQVGAPFSTASGSTFSAGQTVAAAFTGSYYNSTAFVPDVALVSVTGTGSTSFSITATENRAGTVISTPPTGSSFIQGDLFGRVATTPTTPLDPVFYMISQNKAYALGETTANGEPDPFFGIFQPQTGGPFTAATISSNTLFVAGTGAPSAGSVPDASGIIEFGNNDATTGLMAGFETVSSSSSNVTGQVLEGDYTVPSTSSTSGIGTLAVIQPVTTPSGTASFVIISPSELLMITTTSGDANPVILHFKQ
jgi:hypothetical protein